MEDLRKLTGYELERRFALMTLDLASKDFELSQRVRKIEALQAELRAAQDSLAKLEAKKEAEPLPTFEVGKCYRNRRGHVVGPLLSNGGGEYPFSCGFRTYTIRGTVFLILGETDDDLLPGAVYPPPTWTPWPWLPAGEYVVGFADGKWQCRKPIEGWVGMSFQHARQLIGYTSDHPAGRWQVKDGKATYLGEA